MSNELKNTATMLDAAISHGLLMLTGKDADLIVVNQRLDAGFPLEPNDFDIQVFDTKKKPIEFHRFNSEESQSLHNVIVARSQLSGEIMFSLDG